MLFELGFVNGTLLPVGPAPLCHDKKVKLAAGQPLLVAKRRNCSPDLPGRAFNENDNVLKYQHAAYFDSRPHYNATCNNERKGRAESLF